jgi:hypothetical protein
MPLHAQPEGLNRVLQRGPSTFPNQGTRQCIQHSPCLLSPAMMAHARRTRGASAPQALNNAAASVIRVILCHSRSWATSKSCTSTRQQQQNATQRHIASQRVMLPAARVHAQSAPVHPNCLPLAATSPSAPCNMLSVNSVCGCSGTRN